MKIRKENVISVQDWDDLVTKTYGKPYSFQQQDGCKERGSFRFSVPSEAEDFRNDSIPEVCNGPKMGVSFKAWLARDSKQALDDKNDEHRNEQWVIDLWWDRNFYPDIQMVANDLHAKGLLEAGDYTIDIDW